MFFLRKTQKTQKKSRQEEVHLVEYEAQPGKEEGE